jgi:hypothetical protein
MIFLRRVGVGRNFVKVSALKRFNSRGNEVTRLHNQPRGTAVDTAQE